MKIFKSLIFFSVLSFCFPSQALAQHANWYPATDHIVTRWAGQVTPGQIYDVYPRPAMVRKAWLSLNGLWQFAISPRNDGVPSGYSRHILVPFAPESALSGVAIVPGPDRKSWYKRTFIIPDSWSGKRVLLHIGASDWETTIFVNGHKIGMHRGGYDPATFDITYFLKEKGKQEVIISAWDPTDNSFQPRGKQVLKPHGIWYTSVSGIWQTVWIEPVPEAYIQGVHADADIGQSTVRFEIESQYTRPKDKIRVMVYDADRQIASGTFPIDDIPPIPIAEPKLWSPDDPFLYTATVELIRDNKTVDRINTYFGMRKIEIKDDAKGVKRIFLNGKPVFMLGLLDQGWWPDGLYTAPHPEALKYDIQQAKKMGFNTLRKHVKVEPELWYYYCDLLGMFVWQDMPSGDKNARWKSPSGLDGVEMTRSFESEAEYKIELKAIVRALRHHPCIIGWIPFNEGWGQFKTMEIIPWLKELDPSRLAGGPSGGNYFPVGDTRDFHKYPGPGMPPPDPDRALVLGEFGGLGFDVKNHTWQEKRNWGYRKMNSKRELQKSYNELIEKLKPLIANGLCAAIYTQLTDVEIEVNGLITYDREIIKLNTGKTNAVNKEIQSFFNKTVKF